MAHKLSNEKFQEAHKECCLAWAWLRTLPDYKSDYNKSSKTKRIPEKTINALLQKWGFSPLDDPKNKYPTFDFICHFIENFNPSPLHIKNAVLTKPFGFDTFPFDKPFDLVKTFGPLPEQVSFKINWKAPTGIITKEIQEYLEQIKGLYKIRENRNREAGLSNLYKIHILKNLGKTNSEIKHIIEKKHTLKDYEYNQESYKKQAHRVLKKYLDTFLKT